MPSPESIAIRTAWSHALAAGPRGLALARERGGVLAWDANDWVYLLNRSGQRQAQWHTPDGLAAAAGADDGSAYAAANAKGRVWWLAPDLMPRWDRGLPHPATAAALDPLGQYLAVADRRGGLHVLDRAGRPVFQAQSPRPLRHLAFVPAAPFLVGAADYGLVIGFDFQGRVAWRDGLVAHAGSLAVSGDGGRVVLACFSEGLQRYTLAGKNLGRLPVPEPCRLAALTFDGKLTLAAGLGPPLWLLDEEGRTLARHELARPAAALALSALGERAVVALAEGPVVGLDVGSG